MSQSPLLDARKAARAAKHQQDQDRSRDDESGDAGVAAKGRTNMNAQTERTLIEKLNQLPPELIAEVDDFVDFLRSRNEQRQLVQAAMKASEPAFAAVWGNPDDSIYDTHP